VLANFNRARLRGLPPTSDMRLAQADLHTKL